MIIFKFDTSERRDGNINTRWIRDQRNNHYDRIVDPNDILDVDFLSRAIPYCDVVITEKFWVSLAKRKKLDIKYNTHITSDLNDIEKYI